MKTAEQTVEQTVPTIPTGVSMADYAERMAAFRTNSDQGTMAEAKRLLIYLADVDIPTPTQTDDQEYLIVWKAAHMAGVKLATDEDALSNLVVAGSFSDAALAAVRMILPLGYRAITIDYTLAEDGSVRAHGVHLLKATAATVLPTSTRAPAKPVPSALSQANKIATGSYAGYQWSKPVAIAALRSDVASYPMPQSPDKWLRHLVNWENARRVIDALGADSPLLAPYRRALPAATPPAAD